MLSKWFRSLKEKFIAEESSSPKPAYRQPSVRELMGSKYPYIIRIQFKEPIDPFMDLYLSFADAIQWCQTNCIKPYDIHIFRHLDEENKDWILTETEGTDSAFFGFECPDEALIFSIKFKYK